MSEPALSTNLKTLATGIAACLVQKLITPAKMLLCAGIDTAGWLDSPNQFTNQKGFENWVNRYLLPAKPLACTATDLYAARCGLLHTMTPDSSLSFQGKARRICWAWGTWSLEDLQRSIDLTGNSGKLVAVHINDLFEAWGMGV